MLGDREFDSHQGGERNRTMHIYIQQQVATDEEEILNKVAVMDYKEELPKFDLKLDFSF